MRTLLVDLKFSFIPLKCPIFAAVSSDETIPRCVYFEAISLTVLRALKPDFPH